MLQEQLEPIVEHYKTLSILKDLRALLKERAAGEPLAQKVQTLREIKTIEKAIRELQVMETIANA